MDKIPCIEVMQFAIKLGSKNINYTKDILSFFESGYFQYIELFAIPGSFNDTIDYWKRFSIPIIIHAPHSLVGMNLSLPEERENNKKKLQETLQFANTLKSETIILHSGVNGKIEETKNQLRPFVDSRCVIENKPIKGKGTFPLKELLEMFPDEAKITNEAKHDSDLRLDDYKGDVFYVSKLTSDRLIMVKSKRELQY
jgi:sugar phosphate isomerase/epimerase